MSFLLFVSVFPSSKIDLHIKARLYIILSLILAGLALGGLYFKGYSLKEGGQFSLQPSPLIALFMAHAAFSIGWGIKKLLSRYSKARSIIRNQLLFLITASALLLILVPLTNFLLPIVFKINTFVAFSPIYTLLFAGIIAYAIIRQKLFDIRLVVARSVAYALVLATLGAIYGLSIFGLSQWVFSDSLKQDVVHQLINVTLAVILAFSFQPIKHFFDKVTNRIFYRDAYDTQVVLDELSTLLVAEIDLHKIIKGTRSVMENAVKSSFVEFILFENNKVHPESIRSKLIATGIETISELIKGQKKDLLTVEEIGAQNSLGDWFKKDNVAVSLRLKTQHQLVGYILFGEKRSGDIYNSQDLKLLTIVANELAVAIQNALRFEEISRFNITLQQKIDEATKELRKANTKLKELDEAKDEFISMASHQLRTPLTTVKGYVSMVLDGDTGKVKKAQRDMLQHAFDGAERMVYLISDLLNVSRLQSGKFVIDSKPTDLAKLVETEVEQLKESAANHQLEVSFDKSDNFPPDLTLDELKIRQVVMNFLDNAIYYTPAGGSIHVSLQATDKEIIYTVTDTGLGVPKEEQHHLFSKFYRAGNAKKMRPDGTGLGLFMAKKVIVAQSGAIIFKSTEGKGSTFGFSFPRHVLETKH